MAANVKPVLALCFPGAPAIVEKGEREMNCGPSGTWLETSRIHLVLRNKQITKMKSVINQLVSLAWAQMLFLAFAGFVSSNLCLIISLRERKKSSIWKAMLKCSYYWLAFAS